MKATVSTFKYKAFGSLQTYQSTWNEIFNLKTIGNIDIILYYFKLKYKSWFEKVDRHYFCSMHIHKGMRLKLCSHTFYDCNQTKYGVEI